MTDYTEMSAPELLSALGDDAQKWAAALNQMLVKLGDPPLDEEWLTGWFANAIEHSWVVRSGRA